MTKKSTRVWVNGDKSSIGPRSTAGGYKEWNWCSRCTSIWDKSYNYCPDCRIMLRAKTRWK